MLPDASGDEEEFERGELDRLWEWGSRNMNERERQNSRR